MSSVSGNGNPLAFLTPAGAHREQQLTYVLVAALTAIVWDLLTNLKNDHKLLYRHKVGLPTVVYFFARISTLLYVILSTLFQFVPLGRCDIMKDVIDVFLSFSVTPSALQFFFRIRAIFDQRRLIVHFFFVLWLNVLGCCLLVIGAVQVVNIGPTDYCATGRHPSYIAAPGFALLIFDTLACFATSVYLASRFYPPVGSTASRFWVILSSRNVPRFTRSLLRHGQMYFIMAALGNVACVTIICSQVSSHGPSFVAIVVPNVVLTNTMASYVFRSTKLSTDVIHETESQINPSILVHPLQFSSRRTGGDGDVADDFDIELPALHTTVHIK